MSSIGSITSSIFDSASSPPRSSSITSADGLAQLSYACQIFFMGLHESPEPMTPDPSIKDEEQEAESSIKLEDNDADPEVKREEEDEEMPLIKREEKDDNDDDNEVPVVIKKEEDDDEDEVKYKPSPSPSPSPPPVRGPWPSPASPSPPPAPAPAPPRRSGRIRRPTYKVREQQRLQHEREARRLALAGQLRLGLVVNHLNHGDGGPQVPVVRFAPGWIRERREAWPENQRIFREMYE